MSNNENVTENLENLVDTSTDVQKKADASVSEKSRRHFKYRSNQCLNCSQPLDLSDRYCPYCSQLNSTKQLSFGDFFSEFFSSLISYDSRLWFTLKDLLFRPGTITKKYVGGHRLRYANPFRFFLSVSIIYFLLNSILGFIFLGDDFGIDTSGDEFVKINYSDDEKDDNSDDSPYQTNEETYISNPEWEQEVEGAFGDTIQVNKIASNNQPAKISEAIDPENTNEIKPQNDSLVNSDKPKETTVAIYLTEDELQKMNWAESTVERFSTYHDFWENTEIKNAGRALDSLHHPPTRLNLWLYEKNDAAKRIKDSPKKFLNFLAGKVPFFLFFFAPLFALFFWLIFSKKKYSYMEHLVFIFHIFSFIFLAMIISIIPDMLIGSDIFMAILFLLIGPFYFYKALRNFYKQSRVITIIKFVFLNNIFLFAASFFALFFFAITAATY